MKGSSLGGTLLVAGLTIGGGMLALPIVTGAGGFFPGLLMLTIYWFFSLMSGLMFLEVNLAFEETVNVVTMARKTLGRLGEIVAWGAYLLLLYALTAAYLAGSGAFLKGLLLPRGLEPLLFLLVFGSFVAFKTIAIDWCNRLLMTGLVITYLLLIVFGLPSLDSSLLTRHHFGAIWAAIPVIVTSFGYQIIIPTLTTYFHRDVRKIKRALILGGLMALGAYVLFNLVMLGELTLPTIEEASRQGMAATEAISNPKISTIATVFSFFAITTSFLGVSLSLRDFLADGIKMKSHSHENRNFPSPYGLCALLSKSLYRSS